MRWGLMVAVAWMLQFSPVAAGVFSGTVKSVSPNSGELVVEFSADNSRTFSVPSTSRIEMNQKKLSLADVTPGARVSVYTSTSGKVFKVVVKEASSTPQPEPVRPEPAPPKTKPMDKPEPTTVSTEDWSQFRGPDRANRSSETGLSSDWTRNPPKPLWAARGLGEGYSSVAISGNKVITMGTQGDGEMVFAIDLNRGTPLWSQRTGPRFQEGQGNGPRGTPTIDGDKVYALGASGDLCCLELASGKIVWQKNILKDFGGNNIVWGISESVLIDGNKLICTPGGQQATMAALDKTNGRVIWTCKAPGTPSASYASPISVTVDGVKQYVTFTHSAVIGVRADDGEFLWQNNSSANGTANCSSPLAWDNMVFSASGYGTGGTLLELTSSGRTTTARQVYHTDDMENHHGGMVIVDGYLYGTDDPGILTCIELKTGNVAWKNRSVGKGSITYADGHLYLRSEQGPLALVEANPKSYVEKGRMEQPERGNRPAWAHPVVTEGKLFLRDQDTLLVYNLRPGRN